jgi:hypothetical protein
VEKEKERENVQKESRKQNFQANRTKTVLFAIRVMLKLKNGYSAIYALYGIIDSV